MEDGFSGFPRPNARQNFVTFPEKNLAIDACKKKDGVPWSSSFTTNLGIHICD
jgi:hypothetical protein